jgi:hypothetical protein
LEANVAAALRKQIRAGFRELHIDSGSVDRKPTLRNGSLQTGVVFRRTATTLQERRIDQLARKLVEIANTALSGSA